jgi:hypothetical protein
LPSTSSISHIKLGDIDIPSVTARQRREGTSPPPPRFKPTPLRTLHNSLFDALVAPAPRRVYYVGRGSFTYEIIGKFIPPAWIGWMMGATPVGNASASGLKTSRPGRIGDEDDVLYRSNSDVMASLTWEKIDDGEHEHIGAERDAAA